MAKSPVRVEGMRAAHGDGDEPAVTARRGRSTHGGHRTEQERNGPSGPSAFAASRKSSLDHQDP
ncbi:hypothetical protein GCM10009548_08200 [Streptomyces malaysiensis subsp. malaysiensis]